MKNIGKILLLGFMTIGTLAGCDLSKINDLINNGSNSGENAGSDSSNDENDAGGDYGGNSNSSSSNNGGGNAGSGSSNNGGGTVTDNWSEADANLMKAHLYGTVLPYTGDANTVVAYDEENDMITLTGGDEVDAVDYQAALIADDYGLLGEEEDEEGGFYFAVEKAVNTNDGQRFVYVYVEYDVEDGFSAQAFDPYCYSWPADQLAEFFEDWEATPFDVPTIDAENAYFLFEEDEYNILYYVFEMEDYINTNIVAYNCSQSDFTTYYAKLETAGWEIEAKTSEGETYYVCILNIENVGVARMELYYSAEYEAISVTVYAYMSAPDIIPGVTYDSWPAIQIATMLGSGVKDTVPAYTGTNNGFQLLDDYYGMAVVVLVDEGTEAAGAAGYVTSLPDAGYVLDGKTAIGDDRYVSPNEEIYVSVYPAATPGTITIYFEPAEVEEDAEWPAEEIAEALGSSITDPVPGLDGANKYEVLADDEGIQIKAYYDTLDDAEDAQEDYTDLLLQAKYTEAGKDMYDDTYYNSENNQLNICPWISTSYGEYKLIVDIFLGKFVPPETSWPTNQVNAALANAGFTDPLPAFGSGYFYEVVDYGDSFMVDIVVDDAEDAIDEYAAILENAGFELTGYDEYDDSPYYESPNGEYLVNPYAYDTDYFVIAVY